MRQRAFWLVIALALLWSWPGWAQDPSAGRVWGVGVQLIPATSFQVGEFSFPTMTISLRAWGERHFGVETALTFGLVRPRAQTASLKFQATVQVRGLVKFADTAETDFYLGAGVVGRFRSDAFSLPAVRLDLGAEFNSEPNRATSAEIGYGLRLLGEGEFLDRITTGLGWAQHFYPAPSPLAAQAADQKGDR